MVNTVRYFLISESWNDAGLMGLARATLKPPITSIEKQKAWVSPKAFQTTCKMMGKGVGENFGGII